MTFGGHSGGIGAAGPHQNAEVHVAQINVGRIAAPLDSEQLRGFVEGLEPINRLADSSPGFVWRLQTEEGDATSIRPDATDDMFLLNMSVWTSVEALSDFVYRSAHTPYLRERRQWFEKPVEAIHCLWWVEEGHIPTVAEGMERLAHFRRHGSTDHAFTFRDARDRTAT